MRRLALVFAAFVAACDGSSTTTVTPSTVPGSGGSDGGVVQPVPPAPAPVPVAPPCSTTPQVVTTQPFATASVAVDASRVYFAARDGSERGSTVRVWTAPIAGGAATELGAGDGDGDNVLVAATDANVYLAMRGEIVRVAKDGSSHGKLASADAQCLQAAGGFVYWCDAGGVFRAGDGGGVPMRVVPTRLAPPALAVDGDVVWIASDRGVARAPVAGGNASPTAMEPEGWVVARLAVDDAHVYFATGKSGTIYAADTAGSTGTRTLYSRAGAIIDIGASGGFVYWLDRDRDGNHIGRVASDGTHATTLADTSASVNAITVGSDALYWAESSTGRVMRVCK